MALALYFMLANPSTHKKLQEALDHAFPDPLGPLDKHKLVAIPFLDAVLWEALRLGSPYFLPRVVGPNGAMVDGIFVPGGMTVALAAYSQQVSEENFFPDPLVSIHSSLRLQASIFNADCHHVLIRSSVRNAGFQVDLVPAR